jgi:hypothetical protein
VAWAAARDLIDQFLWEPGRDLHGAMPERARGELVAFAASVDPADRSFERIARQVAMSIRFGGYVSPQREAPFTRVHDFLAWLTEVADEQTARFAADLLPQFDAAARERLGLSVWDHWPDSEADTTDFGVDAVGGYAPPARSPGRPPGEPMATAARPAEPPAAAGRPPTSGTGASRYKAEKSRAGQVKKARRQSAQPKPRRPAPLKVDEPVEEAVAFELGGEPTEPEAAAEEAVAEETAAEETAAEETAAAEPAAAEPAPAAPHEAYGKLVAPDIAVVGKAFELEVGLSAEQPLGVAGGQPMKLPSLDGPEYDIDVQIVADAFDVEPGESFQQKLRVGPETPFPSKTVHLTPRPQLSEKTLRTVQATFGLGGETIGLAVRRIDVYQPGTAPQAPQPVAAVMGITTSVPEGDPKADVTIEIFKPDPGGRWRWSVRSPLAGVEPPADSAFEGPLDDSEKEFAKKIRAVVEQNDDSETIGAILVGVGRDIGRAIPPEIWDALRRARASVTDHPLAILLLSDEPYVPWELAIPAKGLAPDEPATFLGAVTNVGRWLLGEPPPAAYPQRTVRARSFGVVQGTYRGPDFEKLPGAGREIATLRRLYKATRIEPKNRSMRQLLKGIPPVDVIHFAVHGEVDETGADDGLVLAQGEGGDPPVRLIPEQVRGADPAVESPFVFLNACQVGAARRDLASYGGLAASFLRWGAAGVVAPIWAIDDDVSHEIALGLYKRAFAAAEAPSVAELLRETRARFDPNADTTSATFLAYQLYGHPSMRLVRGAPDQP